MFVFFKFWYIFPFLFTVFAPVTLNISSPWDYLRIILFYILRLFKMYLCNNYSVVHPSLMMTRFLMLSDNNNQSFIYITSIQVSVASHNPVAKLPYSALFFGPIVIN